MDPAKLLNESSRRSVICYIALVLAVGFIIRIVGGTVINYGYDVHYWAQIMAVISSGNGLYGLTGCFYTPVWGYILGFLDMVQQGLFSMGETAFRVTEALCFEDFDGWKTAFTTSIPFALSVKIPLYLVDLVIAVLVYCVVLEFTGDRRKSLIGFALWFLNPLVILAPMVQGMFDNISALLTLVCVMCLRRRFFFAAGAMMGFAITLKLFPAFLLPLLVAYVLVSEGRRIRSAILPIISAAAGVIIVAAIVFLPQIMDGTLEFCFTFLTTRSGTSTNALEFLINNKFVIAYAAILICSVLLGVAFYKFAGEDLRTDFLNALMLNLCLMFMVPPTPQYLVLLMPFLTIFMMVNYGKYRKPWAVMMVGAFFYVMGNGPLLLLTLSTCTDLIPVGTVVDWAVAYEPYWTYICHGGSIVQYIGILYFVYDAMRDRIFEVRFWRKSTYRKGDTDREE